MPGIDPANAASVEVMERPRAAPVVTAKRYHDRLCRTSRVDGRKADQGTRDKRSAAVDGIAGSPARAVRQPYVRSAGLWRSSTSDRGRADDFPALHRRADD